jgi:hypothetical protein
MLIDPINRTPFYVGKGKNKRAWEHLKGRANYNDEKLKRIEFIRLLGFEPVVFIYDKDLSNEQSLKLEKQLIKHFEEFLTNKMSYPPDRTGSKLSDTHKKILSEKNKGKKLSVDHKKKIGISNQHKPSYELNKKYEDFSNKRNEGSKNPRAQKIQVGDMIFNCKKHAYEYFGVSKSTFNNRYNFIKL